MASISTLDATRSLIAYAVVNDKGSLIKLLKRNGVEMPDNASDQEVTAAIIVASGASDNFKKELSKLLASQAVKSADQFSSFVGGDDMFGFTGIDDFMSSNGPEKAFKDPFANLKPPPAPRISAVPTAAVVKPKGKTAAGKALASIGSFLKENVLTKENIESGVQIGLTKINTKTQGKANQVAQESLAIQQYQDDIRNQQGRTAAKGLSTGTWVAIGVGVVALVGIVIYVTSKRGKQ